MKCVSPGECSFDFAPRLIKLVSAIVSMRVFIPAVFIPVCAFVVAPHFIFASPVINEVLFDPSGTDTGLEKIELYNPDGSSADLSGWELYPDGIGYFTFPSGFSIAPKSFGVIHLRLSGSSDDHNLYHSSATLNMGNSSGSVALFRPGGRSKDTIADFARYHKPGASEGKTWESTAVEAGLWTSGAYVDISGLAEGDSMGLVEDGLRQNFASWKIYSSSSIGSSNSSALGASPDTDLLSSSATSTSSGIESSSAGPAPTSALGAEAGPDASAIAGAIATFRGVAFGLNGEVLDKARFLWNFGDGSLQEGKTLTHIYHFPGTYHVNLAVSSGEYGGSDWLTVTVVSPKLELSEVKPGDGGFVEIFNGSDASVDLAGINITDEGGRVFRLPPRTVVGGLSPIVIPNIVTALNPAAKVILRDAGGAIIDTAEFKGVLTAGSSWERAGEKFILQPQPTPGAFFSVAEGGNTAGISATKSANPEPAVAIGGSGGSAALQGKPASIASVAAVVSAAKDSTNMAEEKNTASAKTSTLAIAFSSKIFLAAGLVFGVLSALGVLILKRMSG